MVVVFSENISNILNKGQLATYASHSAMWLGLNLFLKYTNAINNFDNQISKNTLINYYGYETNINDRVSFNFIEWAENDYRKVILVSDNLSVDIIHSLFVENDIPCYLQRTAHNIGETILEGDSICVCAFGTDEELNNITGEMKLLK